MLAPPPHGLEEDRLAVLRACEVLDTPAEPQFDALVKLAAVLTGKGIALVSLVDEARQWFKARHGLDAEQTSRAVSFCGHAVVSSDPVFVVEDATRDPRFSDNPLVTGAPHVTFYAGVKLRVGPEQLPVGTLCVIDPRPGALDGAQRETLLALAQQVEALLELRLANHTLRSTLEQLRATDDRLNAIVRAMHDGVVMQEPSGAITWCNPAAERILGLSSDQLRGLTSVHPGWRAVRRDGTPFPGEEHPAMEALRTGRAVHDVVMGVGIGDALRWINISSQPLLRSPGARPHAVVTSFSDVTELRAQHVELEHAKDAAESAARAKAEFLATMSHELRTPMNGVVGMAELLLLDTLTQSQRDMVATMRDSGQALVALVNDILDYSKIEAGGRPLRLEPVDVSASLRDVLAVLAHEARRKGLEVRLHDTPVHAQADADALRQVLFNLVGNAVKFTAHGEIDLRVVAFEGRCVVRVRDTGVGIPLDAVPQLFRRFAQAGAGTQQGKAGTGLGLAISKKLVESMNGQLGVERVEGPGSCFVVSLPLADGAPVAVKDGAPAPAPVAPLRILVAEDNPINQRVSVGLLERLGHTACVAKDGVEAVKLASASTFDLILMDVQMPNLDGLAATRRIRDEEAQRGVPPTRIVALTASVMQDERAAYTAAGIDGVLAKPLTLTALLDHLRASTAKP